MRWLALDERDCSAPMAVLVLGETFAGSWGFSLGVVAVVLVPDRLRECCDWGCE